MVICKYFQQGTCRFGQYCKFEHSFGNRSKTFNDDKNVALLVAEEVLQAERGGQWLLSCYGPFKEKKCIPGMEDVSPEEVRWEMYQAQKTGNMNQINAQFQQIYEQIKLKREALKNPTPQIFQMLEELQNSGTENKANYPFGAPQMNANQTSSVFGQKTTYGTQSNPFGSSSSTFNSTQPASSIFGRSAATTTASVFGGKPSFAGTSVFGGSAASASSIFGGANKPAATPFGNVQNTQTFGGLASQSSTSVFGTATTTQSTFGQTAAFGATTTQQPTNSLFKPQTAHSSIFGGGSATAVPSTNVFGGATTSSVFVATPAVSNAATGSNIFGQATTTSSAFGAAPVFGSAPAFGSTAVGTTSGSVFGGQSTYGATPAVSSSNNVFGGASTGTSSFESIAQNTNTNVFGAATTPSTNVFGVAVSQSTNVFGDTTATVQSTNVFGATAGAVPNVSPFGVPASTAAGPFGTVSNTPANSVFATSASAGPFGSGMTSTFSQGTTPFGFSSTSATSTTNVFGTTTATSSAQSPFGNTNAFGTTQQTNSVFVSSTTATAASPFMTSSTQNKASPFGIAPSTQSSPFGNFAKTGFGLSVTMVIDETAYSTEEGLTDDEKMIYRMNAFPQERIPLKPPTKELS